MDGNVPREEISQAIRDVYNRLTNWKVETTGHLTSMLDEFQSIGLALWWNHGVVLLLSTEEDSDCIVEGIVRDSMFRLFELQPAAKCFFRYEEYLTGWPFSKRPTFGLLHLV